MKLAPNTQYPPKTLENLRINRTSPVVDHPSLPPYTPPSNLGIVQGGGSVPRLFKDIFRKKAGEANRAKAYVHTIGTSGHPRRVSDAPEKRTKAKRLKDKTESKAVLVQLLDGVGTPDAIRQAEKVAKCSSKWIVTGCGNGHILESAPTFICSNRFCAFCASKRANQLKRKYTPIITAYLEQNPNLQPFFITYTLKHRRTEAREAFKRLKASLKKLHRRRWWKEQFDGALVAIETAVGSDGLWHIHAHTISFRHKGSYNARELGERLKAEWLAITGDSDVVNGKVINSKDITGSIKELLKYVAKPSDVYQYDTQKMEELLALKHLRFIEPVGGLHRFIKEKKHLQNTTQADAPTADTPSPEGKCTRPNCTAHLLPPASVPSAILMRLLEAEPPDDSRWMPLSDDWEEPDDWEWHKTPPPEEWKQFESDWEQL